MRVNLKIFKSTTAIVSLFFMAIIVSCKDETFIEDASTARAFTPGGLSVKAVKDSAIFTWKQPLYGTGKALSYTLELSKDSLFSTIDYSKKTDTTGTLLTDLDVGVRTEYFYRVKVNQYQDTPESRYASPGKSFSINGQQFLRPIRDFEVTSNSVLLHWTISTATSGVDKAIFRSVIDGQEIVADISPAEAASGQKLVTGLQSGMGYNVQLLAGAKSKGLSTVVTTLAPVFTTVLNPTDNLATAIASAVTGDVIGLNPGTYTLSSSTFVVEKSITIRSVSGNPADTKIKSKEFNIAGNGAGISLFGIDIDGNYAGTSYGNAVFQLYGTQTTNSAAAEFGDIKIENCVIHDYWRCIIRGNYGSAALVQKAGKFTISNSIIYNIDKETTGSSGYYMFSLEKLQFTSINVTKSTFYRMSQGLVNMSTVLTGAPTPTITFDYCTFNAFGGHTSAKYLFVDANSNKVNFTIKNSILANTPLLGTLNAAAQRSGSGSSLIFNNNNYFNLKIAPGGADLNLTTFGMSNPYSIDLGWNLTTTNFLLPQSTTAPSAALFTASNTSSTIGDPRWAY